MRSLQLKMTFPQGDLQLRGGTGLGGKVMDNIIRNWVVSDIFQIAEGERDGHMYLTRPGMDYDVVLYLCEMEKLKCRGTQEQLEEAGFIKVGSATATKVHADKKVEVIAVNYYKGSLVFGNFYFPEIIVYLEGPASRLQFFVPPNLFTTVQADLVHKTAILTMESNYINVENVLGGLNRAAEEEMTATEE